MSRIGARDAGLLLLRASVGGTVAAHGCQKLFGWFGGGGLAGTGAVFEADGLRPGKVNAAIAGVAETCGGVMLAAGLGTPGAGAAVSGTMFVAAATSAKNGFFARKGGLEYPAILGVAALGTVLTGPGAFSFDHALSHRLNRGWMRAIAAAAVVPAAAMVLSRRRRNLADASFSAPPPAETAGDGDKTDDRVPESE